MKKYFLKVIYRDIDPIVKEVENLSKKEAVRLATDIFLWRPCVSVFLFDLDGNLILKY